MKKYLQDEPLGIELGEDDFRGSFTQKSFRTTSMRTWRSDEDPASGDVYLKVQINKKTVK